VKKQHPSSSSLKALASPFRLETRKEMMMAAAVR
jgi:hypothetical protein